MALDTNKTMNKLNTWLRLLIKANGADLHIKTDSKIRARVKEEIILLSNEVLDSTNMEEIVKTLTASDYEDFLENKEFDGAYVLDKKHRFRVNIFIHIGGYAMAFRLVPATIQTIEELNLPSSLHQLTQLKRGLVLITGTTGSGKSTTLASIIEEINKTHAYHIISIEDPVEYIYHDNKSIVEQRELGLHTNSFSRALRSAMREDPDIIVVGEIRDMVTAEIILQAVNTGHLVFSTIHTPDTRETIDRLIAIFPTEEQNRVRSTLASTLEAVVSQRLLLGEDNQMLPAVEIMFKSPHIQELIRTSRDAEIPETLDKEAAVYKTQSFNRALYKLTLSEKITEKQAYEYATSPADLKVMFTMSQEYEKKQHKNDHLQDLDLK